MEKYIKCNIKKRVQDAVNEIKNEGVVRNQYDPNFKPYFPLAPGYEDTSSYPVNNNNSTDENQRTFLKGKRRADDIKHDEKILQTQQKKRKNIVKGTGFSHSRHFPRIMQRRPLGPFDKLDPDTQPLNVWIYNAEYSWTLEHGPLVQWYGLMEDTNAPVYLHLKGFRPHLMIQPPQRFLQDPEACEAFIESLENGLKMYLDDNIIRNRPQNMQKKRDLYLIGSHALNGTMRLIKSWKWEKVARLMDKDQEGDMMVLDIYVEHPKLVKMVRDLVENPGGRAKKTYKRDHDDAFGDANNKKDWRNFAGSDSIPRWCPEDILGDVKKMLLYEADVDFTIRWLVDERKCPCHWFRLDPGKYSYIEYEDPLRQSTCDIELIAEHKDLVLLPDSLSRKLPNATMITLDQEWDNFGKKFPDYKYDDMIQVVFYVSTLHNPTKGKWVLMCYKTVSKKMEEEFDYIFSYDNQCDMLEDYIRFFRVVDPDIILHQNGNRFDLPFAENRARHLGVMHPERIGRSRTKGVYYKEDANKGFKKYYASVPGRINRDLLRKTQDDYPGWEGHSLNEVAKKLKIGMTKGEMPYDMISISQRTEEGRNNIAYYCKQDVKMTDKIANGVLKIIKVSLLLIYSSGSHWHNP